MVRRSSFLSSYFKSLTTSYPSSSRDRIYEPRMDNINPPNPRRLSDNLMDFSSPVSPSNGPNFTAHSYIPLPPRMSLIPGPATSPQDRLSSLTATVTELTKTVQQGMT
ncbi:hypothetical protein RirG_229600 [Rhizophagus irregularis DAOM 197198w]|uniref:Uncharacterized protein n=1 Tax=Rhizophagus irregularis (strain DAOM 197198w) TaxID=1432141 RepID=A0A015K6B7_RHIIW|nr:hypothetical protein RirG_229600 [Rhizophagus irregularis DAOM 197198w]